MRSTAKLTSPLRTHFRVRVFLFVLAPVLASLATTSAQKFVAGDSFAARGKRITTAGRVKVTNVPTSATITSISPSQGPIAGGTQVTLTGSGFTGTTLTLDGATITPQSKTDAQIVFVTPKRDNGIASLKLSGNGPNAYAEFLYFPPPLK